MFKIQFRKKRMPQDFDTDPFQNQNSYPDEGIHASEYGAYNLESLDTCIICDDSITNGHLVVTITSGKYCVHPSCLLSGLALLVNGCSMLFGLFLKRKK